MDRVVKISGGRLPGYKFGKTFVNGMDKKISFVGMQKGQRLLSSVILVIFLSAVSAVQAQLNYFVYFQSEGNQPFYLRVQAKVYSSSASGYLILGKLPEGRHRLAAGFPGTNVAEQEFEVEIGKADRGFLLKHFGDKGWGLFDLQSSDVVYALTKTAPVVRNDAPAGQPPATNDPFANMLADVTRDSTVKQVTVKKDPPPPVVVDTPKAVPKQPLAPALQQPAVGQAVVPVVKPETKPVEKDTVQHDPVWVKPPLGMVRLLQQVTSTEGSDWVFEVSDPVQPDTVRLFIPGSPLLAQIDTVIPVSVTPSGDTLPVTAAGAPVQPDTPVVKEPVVITPAEAPKQQEPVVVAPAELPVEKPALQQPVVPAAASVPNSNCKETASDDDFVRLRRRMAQQSRDEDMVSEARKVFRTRCFSTVQLRSLSALFVTDEWRYRFFDAALPFVTDFSNFKDLETTIKSEYFQKRFQALIPNN